MQWLSNKNINSRILKHIIMFVSPHLPNPSTHDNECNSVMAVDFFLHPWREYAMESNSAAPKTFP